MTAPDNPNELARIAALHSYEVLDTHAEQCYDDITRLASTLFNVPISLISLVDDTRQWFKSRVGVEVSETARELAFCAHAIEKPNDIMVVEDATKDERFATNALVVEPPAIRFYAGQPLVNKDGYALGTLCVIDRKPQTITHEQRESLRVLARMVVQLLEARRTNIALQEQNTYLEMGERVSGLGHWAFNVKNDTLHWSNGIYRIHGISPESYTPEVATALEFYHPEDREIVGKHLRSAIELKKPFSFELRIISPEKGVRYVSSKGECQLDAEGEVEKVFGTFLDKTEQILARKELDLSRERLNLAMQGGEIGFWDWDIASDHVVYSEHFAGMLGYVSSELSPDFKAWKTLCFAEDMPKETAKLTDYLHGDTERYESEFRVRHKDGSTRWVLGKGLIVEYDEAQKARRFVGIHIDITERKESEEEVESSRHFLQTIMDNIPDLIFVKDEAFRIVQANPPFISLYPEDQRENVIGRSSAEEYDEEEAALFLEQDRIAFAEGRAEKVETISFPDGKTRTLYTQKVRFEGPDGIPYIIGIGRDISELKALQEDLASMGHILEDSLSEVLIFRRDDLKIIYANKGAQENLGFDVEELKDMTALDIAPRFSEADYRELLHPLEHAESKNVMILTEHLRKIGTTYDAELHLQKSTYKGEQVYVANVADVSKRIEASRERESLIERLTDSNEELERFAYICSHDLQEPLRMIRSFSDRLEQHLGDVVANDEKASKYFHFMSDGAKRAQTLIADILLYSGLDRDTRQNDLIDLNEVLEVIQMNLGNSVAEAQATLRINPLPEVSGNKTQLYQLFLNLISNGLKYQEPDNKPIIDVGYSEHTEYWEFYVKDNGIGIDKAHVHKVFDVFQRLHRKEQYQGTGIGLSICKKIVERHSGVIWVDSSVAKGSTFFFRLPKPLLVEGH